MRRDTGVKAPLPLADIASTVPALLDTIQRDMFARARAAYFARVKEVTEWAALVPALEDKNIVVIPWCEREACEDDIKERSARS